MAELNRLNDFFAKSANVTMIPPAVQATNAVNFARRFADSRHLDRLNDFMKNPEQIRAIGAKTVGNQPDYPKQFADSVGAKFTNVSSLSQSASAEVKINPYAAGRRSQAPTNQNVAKAESTASLTPTRSRGRSM